MKKITSLFILLTLLISSYTINATEIEAPAEPEIKGKIIDMETDGPLEYATVSLFNSQDSTLVTGVITDSKGNFSLKAKPGKYYVVLQFIGYESKTININLKNNISLGDIVLRPDSALLEEVEVVAEKSTMTMTLDKRVFNVGKDVSSTAGNAIEVLDNIPSVNVDVEGNVSLRGDSGVQILVDGKVSGLAGVSTQDALRSLQADMIEKIEVVTNPSVRYDAEGTAGIINIVLKKDKRKGLNASVDLRGGFPVQWGEKFFKEDFPFQTGLGASVNYRFKKFNVFANYNFNYRDDISDGYTLTEYYNGDYDYDPTIENHDDATQITEQLTYRNRNRKGHNVRGGFDYYFTDNDILTFSTMFRQSKGHNLPSVTYIDNFPFENIQNFSRRTENWYNDRPMMEYTLSYDKYFGSKDNSLKASVRYFNNSDTEWSDIVDAEFLTQDDMDNDIPSLSINQHTQTQENQENLQATVDFVHRYGFSVVELGGKYTGRWINNNMMVTENGITLEDYTHDFDYNQQVAALYGSYGREFGRFSGQIGMRYEFTLIDTYLKGTNSGNNQNYHDIFPTGHLNYSLTEVDQIQASYARRIRRPWYGQMAPFHSFNDDRNIRTGNPELKPVYTDSYEFSYLRFWEKGNINFTTYYRHSTDVIRQFTTVIDDISYSRPENFGISDDYGVELVASLDIFKWWNINGSINFFKSNTVGDWNNRHYTTDSYNTFARLVTKFRIKNVCDLQITGRYMGPREEPLGYRDANYWCDFAASRDVFNKNATISLNIRDVFGSRQHGGESWGDNFWQYSESTWSTTSVTLNFNYRINQQQNKRRMPSSPSGDGDSYEGEMEY
ncbi:MAG: TonB-dependent receptor [Lentimicrobiaceae bacterium]|nr:TonB-dependent receptor [Lentimicrobiaceae bacterium]MBR2050947.1 TonB-dependent receptor [Bacteroidales bacterium]